MSSHHQCYRNPNCIRLYNLAGGFNTTLNYMNQIQSSSHLQHSFPQKCHINIILEPPHEFWKKSPNPRPSLVVFLKISSPKVALINETQPRQRVHVYVPPEIVAPVLAGNRYLRNTPGTVRQTRMLAAELSINGWVNMVMNHIKITSTYTQLLFAFFVLKNK